MSGDAKVNMKKKEDPELSGTGGGEIGPSETEIGDVTSSLLDKSIKDTEIEKKMKAVIQERVLKETATLKAEIARTESIKIYMEGHFETKRKEYYGNLKEIEFDINRLSKSEKRLEYEFVLEIMRVSDFTKRVSSMTTEIEEETQFVESILNDLELKRSRVKDLYKMRRRSNAEKLYLEIEIGRLKFEAQQKPKISRDRIMNLGPTQSKLIPPHPPNLNNKDEGCVEVGYWKFPCCHRKIKKNNSDLFPDPELGLFRCHLSNSGSSFREQMKPTFAIISEVRQPSTRRAKCNSNNSGLPSTPRMSNSNNNFEPEMAGIENPQFPDMNYVDITTTAQLFASTTNSVPQTGRVECQWSDMDNFNATPTPQMFASNTDFVPHVGGTEFNQWSDMNNSNVIPTPQIIPSNTNFVCQMSGIENSQSSYLESVEVIANPRMIFSNTNFAFESIGMENLQWSEKNNISVMVNPHNMFGSNTHYKPEMSGMGSPHYSDLNVNPMMKSDEIKHSEIIKNQKSDSSSCCVTIDIDF